MAGQGSVPGSYQEFGALAPHLRYVERTSRKLARETFYAMARWQGKLERKQGFLGRIVDIGAELFAMSAVCVRAQMDAADAPGSPRGDERPPSSPTRSAGRPGCAPTSCSADCGTTPTRSTYSWPAGYSRTGTPGMEEGIVDPSTPGPWIAPAEPGPPSGRTCTAASADGASRGRSAG